MIQRDRFELLSAYLDGEVTAAERQQVEEWLQNDSTVQQLHNRLLKLRQAFQVMPVPQSQQSVEETVEQVFSRAERHPKRVLVWGGMAIAALFVAAGSLFLGRTLTPEMARSPIQVQSSPQTNVLDDEPVLVALDRPLVAIPKAPVADPNSTKGVGSGVR